MTLSTAFLSNIPPSHANTSCKAAVNSVKTQLQKQKNVQLVSVNKEDSNYPDHPKNRPYSYIFILQGTGADSVLFSDKLMTSLATKIIPQCQNIGLVVFALYNSHLSVDFGLMHNGSIQAFECIERENAAMPKWGETVCY